MKPKTRIIVVALFVIALLLAGFGLSQPVLETEAAQAAVTPTATPAAEELLAQGIGRLAEERARPSVRPSPKVGTSRSPRTRSGSPLTAPARQRALRPAPLPQRAKGRKRT